MDEAVEPPIAMVRPFEGEHPTAQFFTHRPRRDPRANVPLTAWGADLAPRKKNADHRAYDWSMPIGTPLFAALDGTVELAGTRKAFDCPFGEEGQTEDQIAVVIRHDVDGVAYLVGYDHLSAVAVTVGATVKAGDPIGASGDSGCSSGPHLHFSLARRGGAGAGVPIDPYGWSGAGLDPWANGRSFWAWAPDQAPPLYREERGHRRSPGIAGARALIGPPGRPEDEWVVVDVGDARSLVLVDADRRRWRIPGDARAIDGRLRVVTGAGEDTDGVVHAGLPAWWDDDGDCVTLKAGGRVVDRLAVNRGTCPSFTPRGR